MAKQAAAPKPTGMKTPKDTAGNRKVHTGRFVNEESDEENVHDFGPWIMTPKSSRVHSFRYDNASHVLHVKWRDGGRDYVYTDVPYEIYRAMIRVASKGKFVNNPLFHYDLRKADPDEMNAPSNDERNVPQSRANFRGAAK